MQPRNIRFCLIDEQELLDLPRSHIYFYYFTFDNIEQKYLNVFRTVARYSLFIKALENQDNSKKQNFVFSSYTPSLQTTLYL